MKIANWKRKRLSPRLPAAGREYTEATEKKKIESSVLRAHAFRACVSRQEDVKNKLAWRAVASAKAAVYFLHPLPTLYAAKAAHPQYLLLRISSVLSVPLWCKTLY
jgi:hypothetical protein